MATLQDALKKAGLVTAERAASADEKRRQELATEEKILARLASTRLGEDLTAAQRRERWMAGAARETTKAGSRVGTKAYYDRFKK